MKPAVDPGDCLGRRLLILGDVNTGKTTLARGILEDWCGRGLGRRILVVDLAPVIPTELAAARGVRGAGGTLHAAGAAAGVLLVHPLLEAPRLSSTSEAEAQRKAAANRERIDAAWPVEGGRDIVFVNDASMYLQAGDADELIMKLRGAATVVANGYFGERLGGGELTRHERGQMQRLRDWFEREGSVVMLDAPPDRAAPGI